MSGHLDSAPWHITSRAEDIVRNELGELAGYHRVLDGVAIHRTATVENAAVIKPPAIIGPNCFVAAGA